MLFSFLKKKTSAAVDFSAVGCDIHSHLLPGIDDGAKDITDSLKLTQGLTDLGFKKLITTPHIMGDIYPNTKNSIYNAFDNLNQELKSTNIKPAAEYLMDHHFDEMIKTKESLLCIHNEMALVEFSFATAPIDFKQRLFDLQLNSYKPILAHPERYLYFGANISVYDDLKNAGCLFQLNLLSLTHYYGKGPFELAHYLLKKNYIDFVGTDLHHERHLHALQTSPHIMPVINRLLDSGKLLNPTLV